jgi:LPXTG-motif cell wall-anchored protein
VQFGDIFNSLAIDPTGTLYAVAAGYVGTTPFATTADVFVLSSTDKGTTWTQPHKIVTDVAAHMMPAATTGPQAGQLAVGYFRSTNGKTDPTDKTAKWTYSVAESTNATAGEAAAYQTADLNPGFVYHSGAICNLGLLCTSGRELADFTSAVTDSDGCPIFVFGGDPSGSTFAFVGRQSFGCFTVAAAAATGPASTASVAPKATTGSKLPATGSSFPRLPLGAGFGGLAAAAAWLRRRTRAPRAGVSG